MAAMKPRTGDGPMEVAKEGRVIVMRVPLEGGGRLVVMALNRVALPQGLHAPFVTTAALVVFGLSSWALTTLGVGAWWLWTRKAPRDAQPPSVQP